MEDLLLPFMRRKANSIKKKQLQNTRHSFQVKWYRYALMAGESIKSLLSLKIISFSSCKAKEKSL